MGGGKGVGEGDGGTGWGEGGGERGRGFCTRDSSCDAGEHVSGSCTTTATLPLN